MSTFGKIGIGNESIYNQGFSLAYYIAHRYGYDTFKNISNEISKPFRFSFEKAIEKVTHTRLQSIYDDWYYNLMRYYKSTKFLY